MTLLLEHPPDRAAERAYAARVVLGEWLGLPLELRAEPRADWCLTDREGSARLRLPDSFFATAREAWLRPESLRADPLPRWNPTVAFPELALIEPVVPLVAGESDGCGSGWTLDGHGRDGRLDLDVFGSAFFLLSRYEELVSPQRDRHDRFPASVSLAYREGFLERPLLDEYVEILWAAVRRLWPGLQRQAGGGTVRYSCDVDVPYDPAVKAPQRLVRALAGDLVRRRAPARALQRVRAFASGRRGDFSRDPNNSFDWIMDRCEESGLRAAFYVIAGRSAGAIDGCYELDEPYIQALLRRIHDRGHEIGLHGSYNSFRDGEVMDRERRRLVAACRQAGVRCAVEGNRQHYLRWDSATTPGLLEAVGYRYDTTGGFADRPGFRFGTARDFPLWDWTEPPRVCRRPFRLSYAAIAGSSSVA